MFPKRHVKGGEGQGSFKSTRAAPRRHQLIAQKFTRPNERLEYAGKQGSEVLGVGTIALNKNGTKLVAAGKEKEGASTPLEEYHVLKSGQVEYSLGGGGGGHRTATRLERWKTQEASGGRGQIRQEKEKEKTRRNVPGDGLMGNRNQGRRPSSSEALHNQRLGKERTVRDQPTNALLQLSLEKRTLRRKIMSWRVHNGPQGD